jgi:hypothetical protein
MHGAWLQLHNVLPAATMVVLTSSTIIALSAAAAQARSLWHYGSGHRHSRVISRNIAEYLVQAWDVRNGCKHKGAVLPLPSAPEGRGADGVDAMA